MSSPPPAVPPPSTSHGTPAPSPALLADPSIALHTRRLEWLLCGMVCVLALVTFYRAVYGHWAPFDDEVQLIDNERIRALSGENLRWMFTDTHLTLRYTPLSWVTWGICYLFGAEAPAPPSPFPFHVLGVLCHVANAGLVCWLLIELLRQWERVRQRGNPGSPLVPLFAAAAAALWTVHPLRVEVVSWATQVRFAEAQIPAILSLLLYMRAIRRVPAAMERTWEFWTSVALYSISILFYPNTISLPLVLPFLDLFLFQRAAGKPPLAAFWGFCKEKWPYLPVAIVVGILTIQGRAASASTFWGAPATLAEFPPVDRFMQACYVMMYFVWKPFDPTHVSPVYSDLMGFNPWTPRFLVSAGAFIGISVAAWMFRRRWPWLLVAWVAHVLILLPVSGVMDKAFIPCDRYSYFHDLIWAVLLAGGLMWAWPRATALVRRLIPAALVAATVAFGTLSYAQTQVWRDAYALFDHIFAELGEDPFRAEMYWQLAHWFMREGRPAEALEYCDKSLALNDQLYFARTIRNDALLALAAAEESERGLTEAARRLYREAAGNTDLLQARAPDSQNLLAAGMMYLRAGEEALAEQRLAAAAEARPGDVNALLALGELYYRTGRREAALGQLDRAARMSPAVGGDRERIVARWTAATQPSPTPPPPNPTTTTAPASAPGAGRGQR